MLHPWGGSQRGAHHATSPTPNRRDAAKKPTSHWSCNEGSSDRWLFPELYEPYCTGSGATAPTTRGAAGLSGGKWTIKVPVRSGKSKGSANGTVDGRQVTCTVEVRAAECENAGGFGCTGGGDVKFAPSCHDKEHGDLASIGGPFGVSAQCDKDGGGWLCDVTVVTYQGPTALGTRIDNGDLKVLPGYPNVISTANDLATRTEGATGLRAQTTNQFYDGNKICRVIMEEDPCDAAGINCKPWDEAATVECKPQNASDTQYQDASDSYKVYVNPANRQGSTYSVQLYVPRARSGTLQAYSPEYVAELERREAEMRTPVEPRVCFGFFVRPENYLATREWLNTRFRGGATFRISYQISNPKGLKNPNVPPDGCSKTASGTLACTAQTPTPTFAAQECIHLGDGTHAIPIGLSISETSLTWSDKSGNPLKCVKRGHPYEKTCPFDGYYIHYSNSGFGKQSM
jgi:hypothetical protein